MTNEPSDLRRLAASPYGKARLREYHRTWIHQAINHFLVLERRYGLVLSFASGSAVVVADVVIFGSTPATGRAAISLAVGFLIATSVVFLVSLIRTPARLALRAEFEEDETVDVYSTFGSAGLDDTGPPVLEFVTRNKHNRAFDVSTARAHKVTALRFLAPFRRIVRADELPLILSIPHRRGRLIVKAFDGNVIRFGEEETSSVMVRAEVFYSDN